MIDLDVLVRRLSLIDELIKVVLNQLIVRRRKVTVEDISTPDGWKTGSRENNIIHKLICQMPAPNYPRKGNERSRPIHLEKKWRRRLGTTALICLRASTDWLNCFNKIDKKDSKIDFEMNLIVFETIR